MKSPENQKVYLTFPTDPKISIMLNSIADNMGKTQPELIETICKEYIQTYLLDIIENEINENGGE